MFGRVLVVGGNDQMIGAPALAGTAALRNGRGAGSGRSAAIDTAGDSFDYAGVDRVGTAKISIRFAVARCRRESRCAGDRPRHGAKPGGKSRRLMKLLQLSKPMVVDADAAEHYSLLARSGREQRPPAC